MVEAKAASARRSSQQLVFGHEKLGHEKLGHASQCQKPPKNAVSFPSGSEIQVDVTTEVAKLL